jgi:hypothetical protein
MVVAIRMVFNADPAPGRQINRGRKHEGERIDVTLGHFFARVDHFGGDPRVAVNECTRNPRIVCMKSDVECLRDARAIHPPGEECCPWHGNRNLFREICPSGRPATDSIGELPVQTAGRAFKVGYGQEGLLLSMEVLQGLHVLGCGLEAKQASQDGTHHGSFHDFERLSGLLCPGAISCAGRK